MRLMLHSEVPPQTADRLSPDPNAALDRLMLGNRRFAGGQNETPKPNPPGTWRIRATQTRQPTAIILGCPDDPTPPEVLFDQALGDLMVVNVESGALFSEKIIGIIEFGVQNLQVPLLMVLGHSACDSFRRAVENALENLDTAPQPAPKKHRTGRSAETLKPELIRRSAEQVIRQTTEDLGFIPPVLSEYENRGRLRIVGAYHDEADGQVRLVA